MEVKGSSYTLLRVWKGITYLSVFYFKFHTELHVYTIGCLIKVHGSFKLAVLINCIFFVPGTRNCGFYNIYATEVIVTVRCDQALLPLSAVIYIASCYTIK